MGFKYNNWIKRLKRSKLLLEYDQPVFWYDLLKGANRYLICLPDHERNISVTNHYLAPIARDNKNLSISLVVPEKYTGLFTRGDFFTSVFTYPKVRSPKYYPINEEKVSEILPVYDVTLDLNFTPYILSHYITATRGKKLTAGFRNDYSENMYTNSVVIKGQAFYERGVVTLLEVAGLIEPSKI